MKGTRSLALPWACLGLALLCPVMAGAAVHAASDTLDQPPQSATWTTQWPIGGGYYLQMAQVVTAGQHGFLDRVRVMLDNLSATGPVTVSIQTVIGGKPSGTEIGSGTIPFGALPSYGNPQWVSANISGSPRLAMVPGTQYAIVLSSDTGTIRWYTSADYYGGPSASILVNQPGSGWGSWPPEDALFESYIILDTVDQSQSQTGGAPVYLDSTPVGQTFTVGAQGVLDRVSVYLVNSSMNATPITLSLRTVTSGGLPSTTQVASGTIPVDAMPQPGTSGWASADVVPPLFVTAGASYAVLLSTSNLTPLAWEVSGDDVYHGGSFVVGNGNTWITEPFDAAFETRIIPPILNSEIASWTQVQYISTDCQDVDPPWDGCSISGGFVARWSGMLASVTVPLQGSTGMPDSTDSVTVSIMGPVVPWPPGILWFPTGPVIGGGTIPVAAIPPCGYTCPWQWLDASIQGVAGAAPGPLPVTADTEYAVQVSLTTPGWIYWGVNSNAGPPPGAGVHRSYILPVTSVASTQPPAPLPGITPCGDGVCPRTSGGFTPADLTGGITSHFQFQVRPNGSVKGILAFTDPSPGGIALQDCTTESTACRLTVTTFACSDTHAATVRGTYTPRHGTPTDYELTLSGDSQGPGTFSLTAGDYAHALSQHGIVDVTCPRSPTGNPPTWRDTVLQELLLRSNSSSQ